MFSTYIIYYFNIYIYIILNIYVYIICHIVYIVIISDYLYFTCIPLKVNIYIFSYGNINVFD